SGYSLGSGSAEFGLSVRRGSKPVAGLVDDHAREARRRRQPARMREARRRVTFSPLSSSRHRGPGQNPHPCCEIGTIALVYEVEDRHRRVARLSQTPVNLDVTARARRKTLAEQRYHAAEIMNAAHRSYVPRRAAKAAMSAGNRVVAIYRKAQS